MQRIGRWRSNGRAATVSTLFLGTCAALAALAAASPGAAAAERFVFELSSGEVVDLPPVSEIADDCDAIQMVLAKIDETEYRRGPKPKDPADQPLLDYEVQVSAVKYRCDTSAGVPQIMATRVAWR